MPCAWYVLSRAGMEFDPGRDIERLSLERLLPAFLMHPKVQDASIEIFKIGRYDAAVFEAFKVVESEVRSSDDKIVGEVRNIVFGAKDGRDYAVMVSGGFFTVEKDSVVVPLKSLKVSQDRSSFYLSITREAVKAIPVMPDQDYVWLADEKWRVRNDELFKKR